MSNDKDFEKLVEYANIIAIAKFLLRGGIFDNSTYNRLVSVINKKPKYARLLNKKAS